MNKEKVNEILDMLNEEKTDFEKFKNSIFDLIIDNVERRHKDLSKLHSSIEINPLEDITETKRNIIYSRISCFAKGIYCLKDLVKLVISKEYIGNQKTGLVTCSSVDMFEALLREVETATLLDLPEYAYNHTYYTDFVTGIGKVGAAVNAFIGTDTSKDIENFTNKVNSISASKDFYDKIKLRDCSRDDTVFNYVERLYFARPIVIKYLSDELSAYYISLNKLVKENLQYITDSLTLIISRLVVLNNIKEYSIDLRNIKPEYLSIGPMIFSENIIDNIPPEVIKYDFKISLPNNYSVVKFFTAKKDLLFDNKTNIPIIKLTAVEMIGYNLLTYVNECFKDSISQDSIKIAKDYIKNKVSYSYVFIKRMLDELPDFKDVEKLFDVCIDKFLIGISYFKTLFKHMLDDTNPENISYTLEDTLLNGFIESVLNMYFLDKDGVPDVLFTSKESSFISQINKFGVIELDDDEKSFVEQLEELLEDYKDKYKYDTDYRYNIAIDILRGQINSDLIDIYSNTINNITQFTSVSSIFDIFVDIVLFLIDDYNTSDCMEKMFTRRYFKIDRFCGHRLEQIKNNKDGDRNTEE